LAIAQADVTGLTTASSPTFAGTTIGSLAGVILGTAGVLSALDYVPWTTPSFDAGDFTASGSMTWTVESGDVVTYAYTIIGKKMTVAFIFNTTTIGGTPSTNVKIKIPASKTAAKLMVTIAKMFNNGVWSNGFCNVVASGDYIGVYNGDVTSLTAETDLTGVRGIITFEIN
jgi:hypothetical protein